MKNQVKIELVYTCIIFLSMTVLAGKTMDKKEFNRSNKNAAIEFEHKSVTFNPIIDSIVKSVSPDSCAAFLRHLCSIHNRDAAHQYNSEELVPYLEEKFIDYNCDSTFQIAVDGFEAPVVVGVRRGKKDPSLDRVCIIGAHPDTYCTDGDRHQGAVDNGCGNASYLECARVIKDYSFENTILFVAFNAEEKGLLGSKKFVSYLKNNNITIIGGVFNFDMICLIPPDTGGLEYYVYDGVPGGVEHGEKISEVSQTYDLVVNVRHENSMYQYSNDSESFWNQQLPAIIGHGGTYTGGVHTMADSITDEFDSVWLASAISPAIATIAEYAIPYNNTSINNFSKKHTPGPGHIRLNFSGNLVVTVDGMEQKGALTFSLYSLSGAEVVRNKTAEKRGSDYIGILNDNTKVRQSISSGVYMFRGTLGKHSFNHRLIIRR